MVDGFERPLHSTRLNWFVVGLDRHPAVGHLVPPAEKGIWLTFATVFTPVYVFADVAVAIMVFFCRGDLATKDFGHPILPELGGPIGLQIPKLGMRHRMALARRICALMEIDGEGRLKV